MALSNSALGDIVLWVISRTDSELVSETALMQTLQEMTRHAIGDLVRSGLVTREQSGTLRLSHAGMTVAGGVHDPI